MPWLCQTAFCQAVIDAGGDYLLRVKANQPSLLRDSQWLFVDPHLLDDLRTARTVRKGHGRIEERVIRVSSDLADYSRWPGLAQVFERTRTWQDAAGCRHQATSYGDNQSARTRGRCGADPGIKTGPLDDRESHPLGQR